MTDQPATGDFNTQMVRMTPQSSALGFEFVSSGPDGAALKVPYRMDLVGDPESGVIAGGVITTLLDHVCGMAIGAAKSAETGADAQGVARMGGMATLDLRIDYMRPAKPQRDVIGHAHCYKLTHSVAFVRAVAYEDDPADPIAAAQAAFMLTGAPTPAPESGS
jgi:acyl-coenzyme A thioesterase PaaI-like protein